MNFLKKAISSIDMRFVRKNLFLVGFIGVSIICALVLLVLSVMQYFEMQESIEKTDQLREENEKLIRRRIPAVPENIDRVQENITGFTKQEKLTAIYFGQPLYPALKAFCDKLKITPEELRENFKNFYAEKNYPDNALRKEIYEDFRDSLGRGANKQHAAIWTYEENEDDTPAMKKLPLWEDALEIFKTKAQPTTEEKFETHNIEEIFLSSLGVPRNMGDSENAMINFRRAMNERITGMFSAENVDIDILGINFFQQRPVAALKSDKNFNDTRDRKPASTDGSSHASSSASASSGSSETAEKTVGNKADEIRHWEIVCDLSRRLCDAKVSTIEELSYSDLAGKEAGSCRIYTYTLSVTGSEESVRRLLNNLHAAYKDHRVYVVRNLSIAKQEDQIQDIIDLEQKRIGHGATGAEHLVSSDSDSNFAGDSSKKVIINDEYYKEENKYGECVSGRSNVVSATMVIDYVVYNVSVK